MANYSLSNVSVFPSNNILKTDSKITTEENVARLLRSLGIKNHIISGLDATINGTNLTVTPGSAFINGFVIVGDTPVTIEFDPTLTYYLYMYLKFDINGHVIGKDESNIVQGVVIELITDNSTAHLLSLVETTEGGITYQGSIDDFLLIGKLDQGTYTSNQFAPIVIDGGTF